MPFDCTVSDGHIFQVAVQGRFSGAADVINNFQIMLTDGGPVAFESFWLDLRDYFEDVYTLVRDFCNVLTVWTGIEASHLNGNCSTGFVPFVSSISGALANNAAPSGACALLSLPTGVKRVQLRKYFGVLDDSVFGSEGQLPAAVRADVEAVGTFLNTDQVYNGRTLQFGYLSPKAGEWVTPIGKTVGVYPAYQRRRKIGTGS